MALTPQQQATLAAHIAASADMNTLPPGSDSAFQIAALLNEPAAPDFYIWKSSVTNAEILQNGMDWLRVDNLAVGKARIWEWMFGSESKSINPSKPNIRAGIAATWVGNAQLLAVQAMVLAKCKRAATRAEKLFATGTGSTGSPAVMGFEGALSIDDIRAAVALG